MKSPKEKADELMRDFASGALRLDQLKGWCIDFCNECIGYCIELGEDIMADHIEYWADVIKEIQKIEK